ncbi:hypothetical protein VNO78_15227 [Psophocarpus tetragonolobus]|uniref:Uncharacterized protein n=1 Tax=Psophocarpus tetragonolobus TaxID=3891 RepID=A0AAN9XJ13_PSOTE
MLENLINDLIGPVDANVGYGSFLFCGCDWRKNSKRIMDSCGLWILCLIQSSEYATSVCNGLHAIVTNV